MIIYNKHEARTRQRCNTFAVRTPLVLLPQISKTPCLVELNWIPPEDGNAKLDIERKDLVLDYHYPSGRWF